MRPVSALLIRIAAVLLVIWGLVRLLAGVMTISQDSRITVT